MKETSASHVVRSANKAKIKVPASSYDIDSSPCIPNTCRRRAFFDVIYRGQNAHIARISPSTVYACNPHEKKTCWQNKQIRVTAKKITDERHCRSSSYVIRRPSGSHDVWLVTLDFYKYKCAIITKIALHGCVLLAHADVFLELSQRSFRRPRHCAAGWNSIEVAMPASGCQLVSSGAGRSCRQGSIGCLRPIGFTNSSRRTTSKMSIAF